METDSQLIVPDLIKQGYRDLAEEDENVVKHLSLRHLDVLTKPFRKRIAELEARTWTKFTDEKPVDGLFVTVLWFDKEVGALTNSFRYIQSVDADHYEYWLPLPPFPLMETY